jgi:hypothetical protein
MRKRTGKTVRLTGPGLNNWFAEMLVKDQGPEKALENTSGPMRAAVEAVIAEQGQTKGLANTLNGGEA